MPKAKVVFQERKMVKKWRNTLHLTIPVSEFSLFRSILRVERVGRGRTLKQKPYLVSQHFSDHVINSENLLSSTFNTHWTDFESLVQMTNSSLMKCFIYIKQLTVNSFVWLVACGLHFLQCFRRFQRFRPWCMLIKIGFWAIRQFNVSYSACFVRWTCHVMRFSRER